MRSIYARASLLLILAFLIGVLFNPKQAYAQWPPFRFNMAPVYENGRITYNITFVNRAAWPMTDVTIAIPLPEGTRFLEASAQSDIEVTFNGQEVTFFTAVVHDPVKNASFVVEVIDPTRTIYSTHAWIAWKGDQAGDYLTDDSFFDITQTLLIWEPPAAARLQLNMSAVSANNIITYNLYPQNVGEFRMWDVKINVPIPEGTTFLTADASAPFTTSFDGREVSFFMVEMARLDQIPQLSLKVSITEGAPPSIATHAWATWKNKGWAVGRRVPASEQIITGDIVVRPYTAQQIVADTTGDVPFANYDVTSLAVLQDNNALNIAFYSVGDLGGVDEPLEYTFYIDNDCNGQTGYNRGELGAEYRLVYRRYQGQAAVTLWDINKKDWGTTQSIATSEPNSKTVVLTMPLERLQDKRQFCWVGIMRYMTDAYSSLPPIEQIPDEYIPSLARYDAFPSTAISQTASSILIPNSSNLVAPSQTISDAPLSIADISGKLAIPLDNSSILYDVHIFSLPNGQEVWQIPNARQPNFRFDGQRLLINHEGGGIENVFEYNLLDGTERQVSNWPEDSYPYYDLWGNRLVFANANLIISANGTRQPFIFVQCGLIPPYLETEARCRDIPSLGVLVPAGQMGEIQGTHPLWTSNDMIAYKGCNNWAGSRLCGIFIVPSSSTKGLSDGFIPRQLTGDTSDIPSDSKGNLITFTSRRDGNWEAYVMDLNGDGVRNLSNSPDSDDGLPAISPDGYWVAFVSNRGGQWAVWAVPVAGGEAQKLFDLPTNAPWGSGDRDWTNERISWGPN